MAEKKKEIKTEDLLLLGGAIGGTYLAYQLLKKPAEPGAGITGIQVY